MATSKPAALQSIQGRSNIDIMNAIRAASSSDYQSRIPIATQENLIATSNAILNAQVYYNEFLRGLIDKIAFQYVHNEIIRNPLWEFKRGEVPYGKTIEEIFVDVAEAQHYDPEVAETQLFKRVTPNVQAIYHVINREDFYKQTIERVVMKRAFYSEGGLAQLVASIVQALYNSDNYDEFLIMKACISNYYTNGLFYPVSAASVVDESTGKKFVQAIRTYVNKFSLPSRSYNSMGVLRHVFPEDQVLLITPELEAAIDVEVLAAAFHMDKAEFLARRIIVDDFGVGADDVLAVLCDREWLMQWDTYVGTDQVYNGQGLYYNMILHHQGIYSTSRFANAVVFTAGTVGVTTITVTGAATLAQGTYSDYKATATDTASSDYVPQGVNFTISGQTSSGTYIDKSGRLYISTQEPVTGDGAGITITATSTYDGSVTGSLVVKVTAKA